jgi:hypothetical protein
MADMLWDLLPINTPPRTLDLPHQPATNTCTPVNHVFFGKVG